MCALRSRWLYSVYLLQGLQVSFPPPRCPGECSRRSCPGVPRDGVPREPGHNKSGVYFSPPYNILFPSLSVQVMDTHPPKAAAMACNSWTVNRSRFNLLFRFCGVCPVARARSESDNPARLHNSRICSLVVSLIQFNPLAVKFTPVN